MSVNVTEYESTLGHDGLRIRILQTLVTTLLRVIPVNTQGHVWTAGRGSGDGTWTYMDGTDFPYSGLGKLRLNYPVTAVCHINVRRCLGRHFPLQHQT